MMEEKDGKVNLIQEIYTFMPDDFSKHPNCENCLAYFFSFLSSVLLDVKKLLHCKNENNITLR